jgi:hypothetical protein
VELTDAKRKEEITRVLTATDPNLPNNLTKYNYRERAYKIDPPGGTDNLKIHYEKNGYVTLNCVCLNSHLLLRWVCCLWVLELAQAFVCVFLY